MKSIPVVDADEFAEYIIHSETTDGTTQIIYDHPTYGRWEQRFIELGMGRITEQRANLHRPVAVRITDHRLSQYVHHCMCVDGSLGTSFETGVDCELTPSTYHYLRVTGSQYVLSLDKYFHNLHIEVSEDYYSRLLGGSEAWSANLKERFTGDVACISGAYALTPAMVRTIYEIFNTPMSGMLKRMVIEAKMLELIALQWGSSINTPAKSKKNPLEEVKFYLDDTYLQEHSLKEICKRFGLNEFALKNGFKAQFGTTVFEYLIGRRLDHARELLTQPDYSIQQISSLVGYKYANHFSTAFKNRFGRTPRAFAGRMLA